MGPSRHLKVWLGAMYQADVLKRGSYEDARNVALHRLRADQDLRKEAEELRSSLRSVVKARPNAHVEKKTLEYLDDLMKEMVNG